MSPGTTNRPDASITSCTASDVRLAPTETILSSSIRISATAGLWTSPSWLYTSPPRISVRFEVIYVRSSAPPTPQRNLHHQLLHSGVLISRSLAGVPLPHAARSLRFPH